MGIAVLPLVSCSASASESPIALAPTSGSATCSDATGDGYYSYGSPSRVSSDPGSVDLAQVRLDADEEVLTLEADFANGIALVEGSGFIGGSFLFVANLGSESEWYGISLESVGVQGQDSPHPGGIGLLAEVRRYDMNAEVKSVPVGTGTVTLQERTLKIQVPLANLEHLGPSFSWSAGATFYSSGAELVQWADNCNAEWNDMTKVNAFPG